MVAMAELHCHVEGTASAKLVLAQARKYGVSAEGFVRAGAFIWDDFTSFLTAYDFAAGLFRSEEDYALLAHRHLAGLGRDGVVYAEIFTSPDHALKAGLSPLAYTAALAEGMARAKADTGIEARMIVTGVRHFGTAAVEAAARFAATCGHPLVTGFGMAGDERFGDVGDYARAFAIAREAGLGITIHAGEFAGWESVAAVLDHLRPSRIGHGVRACENADLVRRIADEEVVLETCPGSNLMLGVYPSFDAHPFPALRAAGCRLTLNTDDPPHFRTSLRREYELAATHFGLADADLAVLTRNAVDAAFVDEATRWTLIRRLETSPVE